MSDSNLTEQAPEFLPPADDAAQSQDGEGGAGPSLSPPNEELAAASAAPEGPSAATSAAATWTKGKKLSALWSRDQTRNAFLHDAGGKWRKLSNKNTTSFVALNLLASHAHQTGRTLDFKEDGGQIVEIYAW